MKKIFGAFILFTGLCILFFVFYGQFTSDSIQDQMKHAILTKNSDSPEAANLEAKNNLFTENHPSNVIKEPTDVMEVFEETTSEEESSENSPKRTTNEEKKQVIDNALAILTIPSIDLEVAVSEGLSDGNLKYSVAHYDTSASFGEVGNACVVGHRSHTYNRFFNRLDEVNIGDIVSLNTGEKQFSYQVNDVFVVEPKDIWVLAQHSNFAELTLITCTPVITPTHRLIIKATLL